MPGTRICLSARCLAGFKMPSCTSVALSQAMYVCHTHVADTTSTSDQVDLAPGSSFAQLLQFASNAQLQQQHQGALMHQQRNQVAQWQQIQQQHFLQWAQNTIWQNQHQQQTANTGVSGDRVKTACTWILVSLHFVPLQPLLKRKGHIVTLHTICISNSMCGAP